MTKKSDVRKDGITQCIYISETDREIYEKIVKISEQNKRGLGFQICRIFEKYEELMNEQKK